MVRTDLDYINLHKSNFAKSKIILRLENKVIIDMIKCLEEWCKVKIDGKRGWVNKYEIWGWRKNAK
jgi:SH3-like domain-containing protein